MEAALRVAPHVQGQTARDDALDLEDLRGRIRATHHQPDLVELEQRLLRVRLGDAQPSTARVARRPPLSCSDTDISARPVSSAERRSLSIPAGRYEARFPARSPLAANSDVKRAAPGVRRTVPAARISSAVSRMATETA